MGLIGRQATAGTVYARPLARSLTAFSAAQGVALAAGLLLHMVAARRLTTADYGRFALAHSVLLVLLVLLVNGIPNALRRRVSLEPGLLAGAWRSVLELHLPLAACVALALAAGAPLAARALGDAMLATPLQWVAADVALRAGVVEPGWLLFNGAGRHRTQAALMGAHSVLRCAVVAAALACGLGLTGAVGGLVLSTSFSAVLVGWTMRRFTAGAPRAKFQPGRRRELLQWIRWAPGANVLNHIAVAGNLWLARAMTPDAEAIGVYAACYMLASPLLPTSTVLSSSCFRRFAALVAPETRAGAADLLKGVLRPAGALAAFAAVWMYSSGEHVLRLAFGDSYAHADHWLILLWLAMTATAIYWFFCEMLAAAAALVTRMIAALTTGVSAALLTVLMLRQGGLAGSAGALLISSAIGAAITGGLLHRIIGWYVPLGSLLRAAVAAAAAGTCAHAARQLGFAPSLMFLFGLQACTYLACLWVLGEFSALRWRTASGVVVEA